VLALLAIVVSRVRRAERRRRWDEEEEPEAQIDDSTESWPD
jgi:hypothetical protein